MKEGGPVWQIKTEIGDGVSHSLSTLCKSVPEIAVSHQSRDPQREGIASNDGIASLKESQRVLHGCLFSQVPSNLNEPIEQKRLNLWIE